MFSFVYSNENGDVLVDEEFQALGRSGENIVEPLEEEMIPMPEGSTFVLIPDKVPIVSKFESFIRYPNENQMVAALLPQGYTRTLLPAFIKEENKNPLPLYGYTMLAWKDDKFYVAAKKTDVDLTWNPKNYSTKDLKDKINKVKNRFPKNRLIQHLSNCASNYSCFTAQNVFYDRWEGGVPVSPICNAHCLGCISLQESELCPSPQERITFIPSVEEVSELLNFHLKDKDSIISFGQGCEGEPSMQSDLIAESIKQTREINKAGTINMNTNAGYTQGIKKIVDAGIDSLRVSINSANPDNYKAYYRPSGYTLENVAESLRYAAENGVYTYLNLLLFPGLNDTIEEIEYLIDFVKNNKIKAIQFRNLNIDPDFYMEKIRPEGDCIGILEFINVLQQEIPEVDLGNYSKPVDK